MSNYITLFQDDDANSRPWIQLKMDDIKTLTHDGENWIIIGRWTVMTSSAMQSNPSRHDYVGLSVNPEYYRSIHFIGSHTLNFCSALPWTGGGAMDMSDRAPFKYSSEGDIADIGAFIADINDGSMGYLHELKRSGPTIHCFNDFGTGYFKYQPGNLLKRGPFKWVPTTRESPDP